MDQLTPEAARRIAELSRLELAPEELVHLTADLNRVLKLFAVLDGVIPTDDLHHDARSGLDFGEVAERGAGSSRTRPDEVPVSCGRDFESSRDRVARLRTVFPRMWEQSLEVPQVLEK